MAVFVFSTHEYYFLFVYFQQKQILAMKVISKRLLNRKSAAYVENIHAERNILVRVRHPFVVMMHAVSLS